jgi:hypothetical protein
MVLRSSEPLSNSVCRRSQRAIGDAAHEQGCPAEHEDGRQNAAAREPDACDGYAAQDARRALALDASIDAFGHRDDIEGASFHAWLKAGRVPAMR